MDTVNKVVITRILEVDAVVEEFNERNYELTQVTYCEPSSIGQALVLVFTGNKKEVVVINENEVETTTESVVINNDNQKIRPKVRVSNIKAIEKAKEEEARIMKSLQEMNKDELVAMILHSTRNRITNVESLEIKDEVETADEVVTTKKTTKKYTKKPKEIIESVEETAEIIEEQTVENEVEITDEIPLEELGNE